jgi:outer membrane receptor for ferrienterochelin and colicin
VGSVRRSTAGPGSGVPAHQGRRVRAWHGTDSYSSFGSLNTGKHRIRGVEIGLVGNITERLSGQIAATFMEVEDPGIGCGHSRDTAPAGSSYVGHRLSNFANKHFSAQLKYQATEALQLRRNRDLQERNLYRAAGFSRRARFRAGCRSLPHPILLGVRRLRRL